MKHYKNLNYGSSVLAYEYGSEWITIEYVSGRVHTYKYEDTGKEHVDAMKKYADKGKGLDSYIAQNHLKAKNNKKRNKVIAG